MYFDLTAALVPVTAAASGSLLTLLGHLVARMWKAPRANALAAARLAIDERESTFSQCLRLMEKLEGEIVVLKRDISEERDQRHVAEKEVEKLRQEVSRLTKILERCDGPCRDMFLPKPVSGGLPVLGG